MKKLSIHHKVMKDFVEASPSHDVNAVPFGFDTIDCKGIKRLIDMKGDLIGYFEFDNALMLINATKLQVAQMIADKNMHCFNVNWGIGNSLNAIDFAFYSEKYNNHD